MIKNQTEYETIKPTNITEVKIGYRIKLKWLGDSNVPKALNYCRATVKDINEKTHIIKIGDIEGELGERRIKIAHIYHMYVPLIYIGFYSMSQENMLFLKTPIPSWTENINFAVKVLDNEFENLQKVVPHSISKIAIVNDPPLTA